MEPGWWSSVINMVRLLDALRNDPRASGVEMTEQGFVLSGSGKAFDELAREALENAGDDFVALPTSDGGVGYSRVVIITL